MKKSLLLCVCSLFIIGITKAQAPLTESSSKTLTMGYCTSEVSESGMGYDQAGQLAAAVYFPAERMEKLIGNNITKVRYGLVKNRMPSVTVFIKNELTGDVLYEQTTTKKPQRGWNEMVLDVPFSIDGQGIYVGFEYMQAAKSLAFSFTGSEKPYASYMAYNDEWVNCYGRGYGSLSLQCIVEGEDLPGYDISLTQVKTLPYVPDGESVSVENEIGNFGTETIEGLDLTYQMNEDKAVTVHKEVNLPSGSYQTLKLDNIVCPGSRISSIKIAVSNLNGNPDEDASDNERSVTIYSYSKSYSRNILLEQFTTEKCVNCPKGSAFLKETLASCSDVIWIAHHVGYGEDKYTAAPSRELLSFYGSGGLFAPAMMINRTSLEGRGIPVTGIYASAEDLKAALSQAKNVPAFVTLNVSADYEKSTRKLNVEVTGDVLYFAGNDPRITVYLTEDSLHSTTQAGGGKEYIHNHVVRAALTEALGDSLIADNNRFVYKKEYEISDKWKAENMNIIAMVSNYDKLSINNCKVLNVAMTHIVEPNAIHFLPVSEDIRIETEGGRIYVVGSYSSLEVYTIHGLRISNGNLAKGVYLVKVNDGSVSLVKKVVVK